MWKEQCKSTYKAMLKYHQEFAKQIKLILTEPYLADFYNPLKGQKKSERLFVTMNTGLATLFTSSLNKQKPKK